MSFSEKLVKAGYHKTVPDTSRFSWAIASFYKKITNDKGVKYQICGYQYPSNETNKESFMFKVQFELKTGDPFYVETVQWYFEENQWGHYVNTIETVEAFFDNIWKNTKCNHIELYN